MPPNKSKNLSRGARAGRAWTKSALDLLGKEPDEVVARKLKRPLYQVALKRRSLKIFYPRGLLGPLKPWTEAEDALLGKMPDGEVAAQLHRSRMAVWERRKELGIPAYLGQTKAEMAFGVRVEKKRHLGWMAQLRRKLKMRKRTPPHRWTPAEDRMLGRKPDKELARKMGISAHAVAYRRQQLGIKQCPPAYKFWTVAELRMLGTVPDRELAKRLGRSLNSIQCQRCILGIKRYRPHDS